MHILLFVCPSGLHILNTHSYVVLPDHPPEVDDGVWQRALRCDVGLRAVHTLSREPMTGWSGTGLTRWCLKKETTKETLDFCFYLDEVSVDIICVLIGGF